MATPKSNKIKRQEREDKLLKKKKEKRSQLVAQKERQRLQLEKAVNALSAAKSGTRNPKEIIKSLYNGEKINIPISSPLRQYQDLFSQRTIEEREALYRLLIHLQDQRIDCFENNRTKNINAINGLVNNYQSWIREPEQWKSTSYNHRRNLNSLARHLFSKYSIPTFFDQAFYEGRKQEQQWFIHIGSGKNIRTASALPLALTKKAAHHMMQAPSNYDISGAMRYGQIVAMGGDERIVNAILRTRFGVNFANNEFWESVWQWFIQNQMLDTAQYAPIVDYIYNQKFIPSVPNPEGMPALLPPQPHLSMKKREVDATIKQMEEWHKRSGRNSKGNDKYWEPSGIPEFFLEEGEDNKRIYTIVELLTAKELKSEGAAMHHCVGSYASSCSSGNTSVWSMQLQYQGLVERLLTIEVGVKTMTINQARGKYNASPSFKAKDIMNRWAIKTGLTLSRWLI